MIVHVGGADGDAQIADADAVVAVCEEFMEQCGALRRVHFGDELRAAAGERETEAVHGLVGLRIVDVDGLASGFGLGKGKLGLFREERGAVGCGEPFRSCILCGGLLRRRGQRSEDNGREQKSGEDRHTHRACLRWIAQPSVDKRLFGCPTMEYLDRCECVSHERFAAGWLASHPSFARMGHPLGWWNRQKTASGLGARGGGCAGILRRRAAAAWCRRAGTSWRR